MYTRLLSALTAATAVTAAVLPRQIISPLPSHGSPSGNYNITNFQVDNPSGSISTLYTLQFTDLNAVTLPSNVSATCTTSIDTIPAIIGFFGNLTCSDPSVTWSFVEGADDFTLTLKHNWGETVQHAIVTAYDNVTDTAMASFPKSDVMSRPDVVPGQTQYYLDAPPAFSLEYYRYIA